MNKNQYQYINREISWLHFNKRVLQESADKKVPLIERLRFLGIFSNNLDEFFKVRYATVKRIVEAGKTGKSVLGGEIAKDLLEEITNIVIKQQAESLKILKQIKDELENKNIFYQQKIKYFKPDFQLHQFKSLIKMENEKELDYLFSPECVRFQSKKIFHRIMTGKGHFTYHEEKWGDVVELVEKIPKNYLYTGKDSRNAYHHRIGGRRYR